MLFPEYRPKERSAVPKEQPRHQVQKSTYRLYDVKERACDPRRHASSSAKVTTVFASGCVFLTKAGNVTRSVA